MPMMDETTVYSGWLIKSPPQKYVKVPSLRLTLPIRTTLYTLSYYASENRTKKLDSINMRDCTNLQKDLETSHYPHLFSFDSPHKNKNKIRKYYMAADNEEEMSAWVNYLSQIFNATNFNDHLADHQTAVPPRPPTRGTNDEAHKWQQQISPVEDQANTKSSQAENLKSRTAVAALYTQVKPNVKAAASKPTPCVSETSTVYSDPPKPPAVTDRTEISNRTSETYDILPPTKPKPLSMTATKPPQPQVRTSSSTASTSGRESALSARTSSSSNHTYDVLPKRQTNNPPPTRPKPAKIPTNSSASSNQSSNRSSSYQYDNNQNGWIRNSDTCDVPHDAPKSDCSLASTGSTSLNQIYDVLPPTRLVNNQQTHNNDTSAAKFKYNQKLTIPVDATSGNGQTEDIYDVPVPYPVPKRIPPGGTVTEQVAMEAVESKDQSSRVSDVNDTLPPARPSPIKPPKPTNPATGQPTVSCTSDNVFEEEPDYLEPTSTKHSADKPALVASIPDTPSPSKPAPSKQADKLSVNTSLTNKPMHDKPTAQKFKLKTCTAYQTTSDKRAQDQLYDVPRSVKLSQPLPPPCVGQPSNIHQYVNAGAKTIIQDVDFYTVVPTLNGKECGNRKPDGDEKSDEESYVPMDQHHRLYMPMSPVLKQVSEKRITHEDTYDATLEVQKKQMFEGKVSAGLEVTPTTMEEVALPTRIQNGNALSSSSESDSEDEAPKQVAPVPKPRTNMSTPARPPKGALLSHQTRLAKQVTKDMESDGEPTRQREYVELSEQTLSQSNNSSHQRTPQCQVLGTAGTEYTELDSVKTQALAAVHSERSNQQ